MFEGLASRDKDPRKSLHVEDVAAARARPGRGVRRGDGQRDQLQHRVDLDLRADVDVRLPGALRPDLAAGQAARPALPRGRLRPGRRGAGAPAPACTPGSPAREVVAHCLSVELESPEGHNDTMLDPQQRIWGFETNFGGLAADRAGQVQPADAQARPPHLGGGGQPRPGELHGLPPAGQPQRRRHEAGRQRADLGRQRRPGRLRDPVRAQRRRHPGVRRLQRGEGRDLPAAWAPS